MVFCANCGTQMGDDVKFCPSCGTPAGGAAPKPAMEKMGNIRKCPACGAEVPSMTAVCPSCGHEFNSAQVSGAVKSFVDQINAIDVEIATEKEKSPIGRRGWSNWGIGKKTGWVILNIYTLAIPLILSTLKNVLFPTIPPLLPSEQKKKSLIENFVVPNNREDIMEFVLFSSSKVESQISNAGRSIGELGIANMWAKVWSDKCKQLSARAGVVLAGDTQTMKTINNLMDKPQQLITQAKKKELIKNFSIAGVIIIAAAVIIINLSGVTVKVPASAAIPANAVAITGDLDGYYRASGDGFVVRSRDEGKGLSVTLDVEALGDINSEIEKQIAAFIQSKGWKQNDCTYQLHVSYSSDTSIGIDGFKAIYAYGDDFKLEEDDIESIVSSLLKMQPGETRQIRIPLVPGASGATGKKKAVAKLMNREEIQLSITLVYKVTNNATGDSAEVEIK